MATRTAYGRPMYPTVKRKPAPNRTTGTTAPAATHPAAPSAIKVVGSWPDGSLKYAQADGTVLPHGTTFHISGNNVTITNAAGDPIQLQTGGNGRHVFNPVTDAFGMPGVDPALGYAAGAANRGLGYQEQDYGTNYAGFQVGPDGQIVQPGDLGATNADGSPKYGRAVQDYFKNRDRINQGYDQSNQDLHTSYDRLASSQGQSINAAGLEGGGALAQALAKRNANEAVTQDRLDTSHNQTLADLLTGTTRGATDAFTGLGRAVGENAPYQATLQQQAAMQAGPGLVDNPAYEVVGNNIYARQPDGSVKPVKKKPKASGGNGTGGAQAPANPFRSRRPYTHPFNNTGWGY